MKRSSRKNIVSLSKP